MTCYQSITALAAPRITLKLTLGALAIGTAILLPSFVYLFRIFKSGRTAADGVREPQQSIWSMTRLSYRVCPRQIP